jgi:hypothetical protein
VTFDENGVKKELVIDQTTIITITGDVPESPIKSLGSFPLKVGESITVKVEKDDINCEETFKLEPPASDDKPAETCTLTIKVEDAETLKDTKKLTVEVKAGEKILTAEDGDITWSKEVPTTDEEKLEGETDDTHFSPDDSLEGFEVEVAQTTEDVSLQAEFKGKNNEKLKCDRKAEIPKKTSPAVTPNNGAGNPMQPPMQPQLIGPAIGPIMRGRH